MPHQSESAKYAWYQELEQLRKKSQQQHGDPWRATADRAVAAQAADGQPLKYDEGKPMLGLVPPLLTEHMARVFEYGLTKYTRDSWKQFELEDARELVHAALRHIDRYREGEPVSDENLYHLMQGMWNLFIIHWHEYHRNIEYRNALQ